MRLRKGTAIEMGFNAVERRVTDELSDSAFEEGSPDERFMCSTYGKR
jgi:hypothetical protein